MLVLSRKPGEVIHIGEDVRLVVISASRNSVRLGIEAARDILILRKELCDRMQFQEEACSGRDEET